jgi:hypothetical protein
VRDRRRGPARRGGRDGRPLPADAGQPRRGAGLDPRRARPPRPSQSASSGRSRWGNGTTFKVARSSPVPRRSRRSAPPTSTARFSSTGRDRRTR